MIVVVVVDVLIIALTNENDRTLPYSPGNSPGRGLISGKVVCID